jgi:hypothetical protein
MATAAAVRWRWIWLCNGDGDNNGRQFLSKVPVVHRVYPNPNYPQNYLFNPQNTRDYLIFCGTSQNSPIIPNVTLRVGS